MYTNDPMIISLKKPPQVLQPVAPVPPPTPKKTQNRVWASVARGVLVIVLGVGCGAGFFSLVLKPAGSVAPSQTASAGVSVVGDKQQINVSDVDALVTHVSKLILLPVDEKPTIVQVSNLDSLKGQAFFKNAQVGDVVLMYTKAQRAILYRPPQDQVIEVSPFSTDTSIGAHQ